MGRHQIDSLGCTVTKAGVGRWLFALCWHRDSIRVEQIEASEIESWAAARTRINKQCAMEVSSKHCIATTCLLLIQYSITTREILVDLVRTVSIPLSLRARSPSRAKTSRLCLKSSESDDEVIPRPSFQPGCAMRYLLCPKQIGNESSRTGRKSP